MQEDYEVEQMYLNSSDNEDNIMDKKMKKISQQLDYIRRQSIRRESEVTINQIFKKKDEIIHLYLVE